MERYSIVEGKFNRELVLLKGHPCAHGVCTFCDYILDNGSDEITLTQFNNNVLSNVKGIYGVLDVINSGSGFELPEKTLKQIYELVVEKGIHTIYFETHSLYLDRLEEMRSNFSGIDVRFRMGVESFDDHTRNFLFNKGMDIESAEKLSESIDSVCLLVGVKGQLKEKVEEDIAIALRHFNRVTVNIFIENTTPLKRDNELVKWFSEEFSYLINEDKVEVLFENTDLGVG